MNSFNVILYIMFCVHTTYVLIENTEKIIWGGFYYMMTNSLKFEIEALVLRTSN